MYRVLDLPLSMQPLLYDFGQVIGKTEDEYIHQIVTNHVCLFISYVINNEYNTINSWQMVNSIFSDSN